MSARTTRIAQWLALCASAAVLAQTPLARAQQAAPEASSESARAAERYQEGVLLLQERKLSEALDALDASLRLQPSPNTSLVKAHALRLLERRVEALTLYDAVVREAGARVRAGEDDLRSTLADAGRWFTLLRAELGEVSVEVRGAADGTTIVIAGKPAPAKRDADGVTRAHFFREPGSVRVSARAPSGAERSAAADVAAGATATLRLDLTEPAATPPAAPPGATRRGPPPATWIAWGVGAVGVGAFAVFGALSRSVASDLDACSPRCPQSLSGEAERGRRDQTIADVSLAMGGVGIATGIVLWALTSPSPAAPAARSARPSIAFMPGAASFGLGGRF